MQAGAGVADAARAARQDCPLLLDNAPPLGPSSKQYQGALASFAAAVARFEAEAAQRIPADTLPEASLEDLRLQTPALRPVGCWWWGCAPAASGRSSAHSRAPVNAREVLLHERGMPAQVPRPVRRDGSGPAAAAVLRLQHRALLLRGVPEGGLARGRQGRVPRRLQAVARQACRHRRPVLGAPHLLRGSLCSSTTLSVMPRHKRRLRVAPEQKVHIAAQHRQSKLFLLGSSGADFVLSCIAVLPLACGALGR